MAVPLVQIVPKVLKSGKTVYKRGHWRVSESAYRSQRWRLQGGKAGTASKRARIARIEAHLRAELGAPPAGKRWQQIAGKYPERFADYTEGFI